MKTYHETRFRIPSPLENKLGLWVDRIGSDSQRSAKPSSRLRILGQYAAVAIETGSGCLQLDGKQPMSLHAGDVILLRPKEPASYYATPTWTSRWVVWNGPEANQWETLGMPCFNQPIIHQADILIKQATERLSEILTHEDVTASLERKRIITDLVLGLSRRATGSEHTKMGEVLAAKIMDFMTSHYMEPLSIEDLTRKFHLSSTHFRRLFKERTGRCPGEYLNVIRMTKAQELLSRGIPIKDVSPQVGFEDVFYFMRVFRKITGSTAGRFQRQTF